MTANFDYYELTDEKKGVSDGFNYKEITKKTGLSKSTLYRMCEPNSNPTLENISKVLNYINYLDEKTAA